MREWGLRLSELFGVQTLKRGKTAKIAKAVVEEEEEEEGGEATGGPGPGGGAESAIAAEAAAIRSEALEEKQLAQQQRVSEVSCCVCVSGGVCLWQQVSRAVGACVYEDPRWRARAHSSDGNWRARLKSGSY